MIRPSDVTRILDDITGGKADRGDIDDLYQAAYDELHVMARNMMRRERPDHTLQPTALMHEAYIKLSDASSIDLDGRAHIFGIAIKAMRRILIQHARKRNAEKRGGSWQKMTLSDLGIGVLPGHVDILELNDAIEKLGELDERSAKVVELRIIGDLKMEEIASCLGVSRRTIQDDWKVALAWLKREFAD